MVVWLKSGTPLSSLSSSKCNIPQSVAHSPPNFKLQPGRRPVALNGFPESDHLNFLVLFFVLFFFFPIK